jgi:hypothetical protein
MSTRFYIINTPKHPWGDYGYILTQGMAHRGDSGILEIERTGPFVPAVTMPGIGEIVVTEKLLIVSSDWNLWDQDADEPREHTESGEPEDYVLGQPHSVEADEQMGNLWALELNRDAQTQRERRIVEHRREIKLVTSTWRGQDIFAAQGVRFIYLTESAKVWFERNVPGGLTFEVASVL